MQRAPQSGQFTGKRGSAFLFSIALRSSVAHAIAMSRDRREGSSRGSNRRDFPISPSPKIWHSIPYASPWSRSSNRYRSCPTTARGRCQILGKLASCKRYRQCQTVTAETTYRPADLSARPPAGLSPMPAIYETTCNLLGSLCAPPIRIFQTGGTQKAIGCFQPSEHERISERIDSFPDQQL